MKASKVGIIMLLAGLLSGAVYSQTDSDVYNGNRGENFNHNWVFQLGDESGAEQVKYDDSLWRELDLPHDWSIELAYDKDSPAGDGGGYLDGGIGWYRKTFKLPMEDKGKKIYIQFDGVYMDSYVWINGHLLGNRPNGYNSFEYDLTPYLSFGEQARNVIAVKVNNKQPSSRWYSGSGIYRNVWLTKLSPVHIAYCGMFATTAEITDETAVVNVSVDVLNETEAAESVIVYTEITDSNGVLKSSSSSKEINVQAISTANVDLSLEVAAPRLWSPAEPYLYQVKAIVSSVNSDRVDSFSTKYGIRQLEFDANKGFSLNGKRMKIKGTCMHPCLGCLGRAINYRAMERQVEILKEMGCNAIRTAHNAPAPEMLDICNRLGMFVMDETFDCWETRKVKYDYARFFTEWAQRDIRSQVRRDRNNPCVILWSIGNEIYSPKVETAKNLKKWVKLEDTTRPVTWASNVMNDKTCQEIASILDVAGYNYWRNTYYPDDHKKYPERVIFGSETCATRSSRETYVFPPSKDYGNLEPDIGSEYNNSFGAGGINAETDWNEHARHDYVAGLFVWTGFDYLGENGWPTINNNDGIVDRCGFPKDIYYFYKSQWDSKPVAHILPHWNWNEGDEYLRVEGKRNIVSAKVTGSFTVPVYVYTNCEKAELFLNSKSLGVKSYEDTKKLHLEWDVPFEAGTLKVVGISDGLAVVEDVVKTADEPTQIRLSADRSCTKADGEDLAFVKVDIVDSKGEINPRACNKIIFSISGPATIIGVDNGNSMDHSSYKAKSRDAFNGKCLAVIRGSDNGSGRVTITASSDGLASDTIEILSIER